MHFGRCELRLQTRELLVSGRPVPVRRLVFDLMVYLVTQRHRVVSHKELLREVWGNTDVSPKMLARAVMEARRACGDPADDPTLFVSARGVGYRFVGTPVDLSASEPAANAPDADETSEVRQLLRRTRQALDAGQLDDAQTMADAALAKAEQGPSNADRVHALVLCSALALRCSTAVAAARLATQALQIARSEGQPQLVAQARLAVGYVHLVAGDRTLAIRHFEESREALSAPGLEEDLQRCLNRLAMAFRGSGKPEVGLQISRRALSLALQLGKQDAILIERNNEMVFLLHIGDQQAAEGQAADARRTFEEALLLVNRLLQDQPAGSGSRHRQSALGNRAFILQRLGRQDEAWRMLDEFEAGFEASQGTGGPISAERRQVAQELRATLLADAGWHDEALQLLSHSIETALLLGRRGDLPRLYGQASALSERTGQLGQALRWARLQGDARAAVQAGEATALAHILQAEMNAENTQAELQQARAQVSSLLHDNAELRQQAELMQGTVPVAADTRLARRDQLVAMFSARHRHARAKGLPMCIGLLLPVRPPAHCGLPAPEEPIAPAELRRLAEVLSGQADIAYPAIDVGNGRVAFRIRDAGPTHAAEVCRRVLEQLQQQDWSRIGPEPMLTWQCKSADAARFDSIEACVQSLEPRPCPTSGRLAADASSAPPDYRRSTTALPME